MRASLLLMRFFFSTFKPPPKSWFHNIILISKIFSIINTDSKLYCCNQLTAFTLFLLSPVSWCCRIHRLHLYRGIRPPPPHTHTHTTSVLGMILNNLMELWGMLHIPLLPLLSGPLWPGVVAPDRVLSFGQIELFDI